MSALLFPRASRVLAWSVLMALVSGMPAAFPADVKAPDAFAPAWRAAIDAALAKSFAASKAPGVVVGIWIPGEGSYVATRGVSDIKTGQPMRVDDHFRIGSITKTFTATLLLIFADEKKLRLDDPVSKYVAWVPNGDRITLRMLADMTAGLHSYTEDDAWVKIAFSDFKRVWTPRELVDAGLKSPPDFAPGQGWHYSNTNYVLLGMILEQVAGKKIQDAFAEKIIKPLKLTQTSWPVGDSMPKPYAHGTTVQTLDDKLDDATYRNPSWAFTAGELVSTMTDLRRWVVSYSTGTLISPEMQKQRLTWMTMPPNTPERAYGIGIGTDHGWLGHTGELPGYNCSAFYLPDKKAVIVVMVNTDIPSASSNPAPTIMKALARVVTPGNVPQ
ncbi:MAG: serine hydrolase domain-containing protein [Betaproteobacteria bacterium]